MAHPSKQNRTVKDDDDIIFLTLLVIHLGALNYQRSSYSGFR